MEWKLPEFVWTKYSFIIIKNFLWNSPSNGEGSSNVALISQKSNSESLSEEQSLDFPEGDLSLCNVEKGGNRSLEFLLNATLYHFQWNPQIPIGYQHSIGSPSLLQFINTNTSKRCGRFEDENVKCFFKNYTLDTYSKKTEAKEQTLGYNEFLKEILICKVQNLMNKEKNKKK